nr:reverse transcriptase domain-containing protein [Tanacetum cinerariifolium]
WDLDKLTWEGRVEAWGTVPRLMDKAFNSQIDQNIEVYVDDLVVKSYTEAEKLRDVDETFRTLRKINMKLNPKKCTFRVAEGVFLGYVVTPDGIKPCSNKTATVLQLSSPRTIKEEGRKKALLQGSTVRINGGNSLQAVVPHAVVKMFWTAPGGGIDIAGPLPEGPGKVEFLIVAMDYFTKWIEAKAVATITGRQVKKFVWDNIMCRFGLLGEIVSDNGKQFSNNPFKYWCDKLNITQRFAPVKHPQFNGHGERATKSLGEGIKARLDEGNKNWGKELPHVLWAHRTMIKSSHGDTPFSLTYGTEAFIPTEIGMLRIVPQQ